MPGYITSDGDMRKRRKLSISIGTHLDVWESIDDIEWKNITIMSSNTLKTTSLEGFVIYHVLEKFHLNARVD